MKIDVDTKDLLFSKESKIKMKTKFDIEFHVPLQYGSKDEAATAKNADNATSFVLGLNLIILILT
jgi:hypothetical protein